MEGRHGSSAVAGGSSPTPRGGPQAGQHLLLWGPERGPASHRLPGSRQSRSGWQSAARLRRGKAPWRGGAGILGPLFAASGPEPSAGWLGALFCKSPASPDCVGDPGGWASRAEARGVRAKPSTSSSLRPSHLCPDDPGRGIEISAPSKITECGWKLQRAGFRKFTENAFDLKQNKTPRHEFRIFFFFFAPKRTYPLMILLHKNFSRICG